MMEEDERHKAIQITLRVVAGAVLPVVAVVFGLSHIQATGAIIPPLGLPGPEPPGFLSFSAVGVIVLLGCAAGFYAEHDHAQAYRAIAAAIFTGMAAVAFATSPGFNLQNVLIGLAVVISVAAIVVPPSRHASESDPTARAGHA